MSTTIRVFLDSVGVCYGVHTILPYTLGATVFIVGAAMVVMRFCVAEFIGTICTESDYGQEPVLPLVLEGIDSEDEAECLVGPPPPPAGHMFLLHSERRRHHVYMAKGCGVEPKIWRYVQEYRHSERGLQRMEGMDIDSPGVRGLQGILGGTSFILG
ncbi:hypothetical protein M758_UG029600 [Ceratodon purpureus]|nr:hypothetical protein M758_UG029600 [Ceratodon purpureus]